MNNIEKSISNIKSRRFFWFFWLVLFMGVGILRLFYCMQLTVNTGDAARHVCWGIVANQYGYGMIDKPLFLFGTQLRSISWSGLPYNYPVICLFFDQLCAGLYPSVFCMKLMLTGIEALNSMLVYKYARSRLLALLYWISPISIWWVSHEGQFEPLQNLMVILALILFKDEKRRNLAYVMLGLAVQVKLTAVFILPYFVLTEWKAKLLLKRSGYVALGFLPTILVSLVTDPFSLLTRSAALRYNPYFFNVFNLGMFKWNPVWLVSVNQISTYLLLMFLCVYGLRKCQRKVWAEVGPAILFLIFIKLVPNAQFWYMVALLPMFLPISNERLRLYLFTLSPLLDIRSTVQIFFGPFGKTLKDYYTPLNDSIFTSLRTLFKQ